MTSKQDRTIGYFRIATAIEVFSVCLLVGLFSIGFALADGVAQWVIGCTAFIPTLAVIKGLFHTSADADYYKWFEKHIASEMNENSESKGFKG